MISRFFKKSSKKTARVKTSSTSAKKTTKARGGIQKLLTAVGWKRLMMRKKTSLKKK